MGKQPICLSMAALEGAICLPIPAQEGYRPCPAWPGISGFWQWLFPLQNHPIAAPARPHNRQEIAFMNRKIYIR